MKKLNFLLFILFLSFSFEHVLNDLSSAFASSAKRFTNSVGMEFVYIKPGTFMMGFPLSQTEKIYGDVKHKVTLTKPYYMQTTEVTQGQWKKVMGNNPSLVKDCGDECPVEFVSWFDVKNFVKKLNKMDKKVKYRLPTEAQWEYAARAGTKGDYGGDNLSSMAWYDDNSGGRLHKVGQKKPNKWGLYDMHGNAFEWCEDWYGDYPSGHVKDPTGPDSGTYRVNRGGSWTYEAQSCRSAYRGINNPDHKNFYIGFRVVAFPSDR